MQDKYVEDYIEELSGYFPQIEEKELTKMMENVTSLLTMYLKDWYRGFSLTSLNTLVGDGKRERFKIARIFGKKHLNCMRKVAKKYNEEHGTGK